MSPILLSSEIGVSDSPAEGRPEAPWYAMSVVAPENCDLWLDLGDDVVVAGWCSRRFLNGASTYWAWRDGRCGLVIPCRWRFADADPDRDLRRTTLRRQWELAR